MERDAAEGVGAGQASDIDHSGVAAGEHATACPDAALAVVRVAGSRPVADGDQGGDAVRLPPFVDRLVSQARQRPRGRTSGYECIKRALDIVGAATLIVALSPLMLFVAIAIELTSRGPIIYRQQRAGLDERPFTCLKFRTMVPDAEWRLQTDPVLNVRFHESFKLRDDPRVTPLGRFLRASSIDELPQLFNVLGGSMSLIGPRPLIGPELEHYGADRAKLYSVKPGLGGLWQVCGRSSTSVGARVALDMIYIDHRSLRLDMGLAALTVLAVLRRQGAS